MLLALAVPAAGVHAESPKAADQAAPTAAKENKPASEAARNPSGTVMETMTAGGYNYARLEKDGKSVWVAYSALETRVGDKLAFKGCTEMQNFTSKTLKRSFDSILFCDAPLVKPQAKAAKVKSAGKAQGKGEKISVAKAEAPNAYTVAEVFAKRAALHGKEVTVRGQVVKVAAGIMNRNWIHLQDGTGDEKQKTNDLVVTSSQTAQEGEIITISGKVANNKDFGSGYKYKVIIEKGVIKK